MFLRSPSFPTLGRAQFLALTTFRRNGAAVTTPVLFAPRSGGVVMITAFTSGKVRRLRANPAVTVAPCLPTGWAWGAAAPGKAHLLADDEAIDAAAALRSRYPIRMRILLWAWRRRDLVYLAVEPTYG